MTRLVTGGAGFIGSNFVLDWLDLHQAELMEDWALAQVGKALKPIAPLE
jgi:dTDP-D-glucose 4,6-dehydratase